MSIRPSSLPFLAQCACWESDHGEGEVYKSAGVARHEYLAALLRCELSGNDGADVEMATQAASRLSEEDRAAVEWAAEYIKIKAPLSDHPLRLEYHVNPLANFKPIFPNGGTLDAACGPVLFDLKSRERDYEAQMAAYALGMFQQDGWEEIEVHLLFTETKRAQVFKLTEAGAEAIVNRIAATVADPNRKPTLCDYCGWCARRLTCPAKTSDVAMIANAREDVPAELKAAFADWIAKGAHTSKIEDPAIMGMVLSLARRVAPWCEGAEHHAKEMAIKKGMTPTGFKIQTRQGNRYVSSVADAFPLVGLPQTEFLKACSCQPSALFEAYAAFNGVPKSTAEKELTRKLGDVLQRKQSTMSLVAEKGK